MHIPGRITLTEQTLINMDRRQFKAHCGKLKVKYFAKPIREKKADHAQEVRQRSGQTA
jgi:hypothetical protein